MHAESLVEPRGPLLRCGPGDAKLVSDDRERHRLREVAEELDAEFSEDDAPMFRPRYNVAPSDTTWMLESRGDDRVLAPAEWGYVARDRPLINVRAE